MTGIQEWWSGGDHVELELGGTARSIFVRREGSGQSMTLLHGYPSSSHDFAKMVPALAADHALLMPDFLGFGASEKPVEHNYSIHEQADLVEALWAYEGTTSTTLVGHDYAVSVVQELLARRAEGTLGVNLRAVRFMNGGIYPDLHRQQPIQQALLDPEQGPKIGQFITREAFIEALRPTFAPECDFADDAADIYTAMSRDGGLLIGHLLIRYITDRLEHEDRWVGALENTGELPVSFAWGMLDPVSGSHMAERIRERLPDAPFVALGDVAHWPLLEAPDRVAATLLGR